MAAQSSDDYKFSFSAPGAGGAGRKPLAAKRRGASSLPDSFVLPAAQLSDPLLITNAVVPAGRAKARRDALLRATHLEALQASACSRLQNCL